MAPRSLANPLGTALAALLTALVCSAQDRYTFVETFDSCSRGSILGTGQDRYKTANPTLPPGMVEDAPGGAPGRVLAHRSSDKPVITRIVDGVMPPLNGTVEGRLDITPYSGSHAIYFWEKERVHADRVLVCFLHDGAVVAIVSENGRNAHARIGGTDARWEPGKRYRLLVTMHIGPDATPVCRFDVTVQNLTDGKALGTTRDCVCPGHVSAIGAGQILSSVKTPGTAVEALFDNWHISGTPSAQWLAAQVQGQAYRERARQTALPETFTPDGPAATNAEVDLLPYLPAGSENLVRNSSAEQQQQAWQAGEEAYTADRTANFEFAIDTVEAHSARASMSIVSHGVEHSGYWSQAITVKGGTTYFIPLWCKAQNARVLTWIAGRGEDGKRFDRRIYLLQGVPSHLVPLYLHPRYTTERAGQRWRLLCRTFTTPPGLSRLRVSLGSYFGEGRIWFDDVSLTPMPDTGIPVRVVVQPRGRRATRVSLHLMDTGDEVFSDDIPAGVQLYDNVVAGTDITKGYVLRVRFDDDTTEVIRAPARDQTLER